MYQKILIATDGSELSGHGLDHGLKLAKALNVPVAVVTATEMWSASKIADEAGTKLVANPVQDYEKHAADAAKTVLAAAKEAAEKAGVACECVHVADQHPADGILATATAKNCDLIVMASHGRRGVKRVLLGSVTAEVLGNSKVPVLVIR